MVSKASQSVVNVPPESLSPGGVQGFTTVALKGLLLADNVDQAFFLATRPYRVVRVSEVHATAESVAGSLNLQVTKDTGTDAPGAGTDLLTNNTDAGFDLKGTANTVQAGALTATTADLVLAAGDRLSVAYSAAANDLAGVLVQVDLVPV